MAHAYASSIFGENVILILKVTLYSFYIISIHLVFILHHHQCHRVISGGKVRFHRQNDKKIIRNFYLKRSFGNFARKLSGNGSKMIFGPPKPWPSLRPCSGVQEACHSRVQDPQQQRPRSGIEKYGTKVQEDHSEFATLLTSVDDSTATV